MMSALTWCVAWLAFDPSTIAADAGWSARASLEADRPAVLEVPRSEKDRPLTVTVAVEARDPIPQDLALPVRVGFGDIKMEKTLHLGDHDVAWTVRQPAGTAGRVEIGPGSAGRPFSITVVPVPESNEGVSFEQEPNDSPESANPLTLGRTVYGLADDRPSLPQGTTTTDAERTAGADWFRFTFDEDTPRLAFFGLEFVDRDVPPDVRIYTLDAQGKPVEYTRGIDPQASQRERPPRVGANKFTTRVLTRGTYYVWVDACHPEYQLRTKLRDLPPYLDPKAESPSDEVLAAAARKAVRTAMDFQLLAGDSWHANTPRKGHPMDRVANPHHETSTCIACHPTHFTTQSVVTAVKNGYDVEEPFAFRFLTERLANNPVPFHGYPEAVWARMIPAPANVLGRLSTILMDFEDKVGADRVDPTHRAIAEFLKLYYDGRTTIAADESNGNNPISRYKVAADAWRQLDTVHKRTREARYAETRDLVARLLTTGTPSNVRDLAAQTIGLTFVNSDANRDLLQANVRRLLELQRPDGGWPIKFDDANPSSQMQTGESLYALSLAGLPADHPAIRKGVLSLLTQQQPFGGWLDLHPYEQFRTPFRETQWSLMALSRIYPNPQANPTPGWHAPLGPEPKVEDLAPATPPGPLVAALDRMWDPATGERLNAVIALARQHPGIQVQAAACRALGRIDREGTSLEALVGSLGHPSKVVRVSAASAVRVIGNRLAAAPAHDTSAVRQALLVALKSDSVALRRGTLRVFAAHFRELSRDQALADALLDVAVRDADPVARMQAIKGLWRIWYWQSDIALRERIENTLIERLGVSEHPWVRLNLTEALYIIGDENIRYLYNNWVPSLASEETRKRVTEAQHATANRLAEKYVLALKGDNALRREGVLRSIVEFTERPPQGGRVGNDLEFYLVYGEMLPKLAQALVDRINDPDPTIRRLALEALVAVRGHRDPTLARATLARRGDTDPDVREWAAVRGKEFPLPAPVSEPERDATLATIDTLLASPVAEARAEALTALGKLGPKLGKGRAEGIAERIRVHLQDSEAPARASAISALAPAASKLLDQPEVKTLVVRGLEDQDVGVRAAAVRLVLERNGLVSDRTLRKALEDEAPAHRIALLSLMTATPALAKDLRLIGPLTGALTTEGTDAGVREKALQVVQANPGLVANPAVEDGLRQVAESKNARQVEIAKALLASRGRSSASGGAADRLDLAYFEAKVLPIFNSLGEDGQNCIGCHRSHTILKMVPADQPGGRFSERAVRENYRSTLRVINLAEPTTSLLLGKPTWEAAAEAEAQGDPSVKAHAGGVRFETKDSPEYQTLLNWINGARLETKGTAESEARR